MVAVLPFLSSIPPWSYSLTSLQSFFLTLPFMPHGQCYLWRKDLMGLHILSDAVIAFAYYCIPFFLLSLARQREDLPFKDIFVLFGAFIISCGTTHLLSIWTLWYPQYWLDGGMKAITAFISLYTSLTLFPLMPRVLAIPSPAMLQLSNDRLAAEILERQEAQAEIQRLNADLESRIAHRTQELEAANQVLRETNEKLRDAIKEKLRMTLTLENQRRSFQNLLDNIPNIIARFDVGLRHVYVNPAVEQITGIPAEKFLNKTNTEMGMPPELVQQWENQMLEVFTSGQPRSIEFAYTSDQGTQIFQSHLIPEYADQEDSAPPVEYVLAITRDITVEKHRESQLRLAAEQDGLTRLANRRAFDQYLEQQWLQALSAYYPIALILCDVDFFKLYNDTYGHLAGDACLQQVAQALRQTIIRPQDLVARYGGEEFGIILPGVTLADALEVARSLRWAVSHCQVPHRASPLSPYVSISLGCASGIPCATLQPADLINQADRCLYQAKQQGRNQVIGHPLRPDQPPRSPS